MDARDTKGKLFLRALGVYWRTIVVVLWPLIMLPIFILGYKSDIKCLYVVCIMAIYWVTEALPLAITSLIPMVAFPLLGILSTGDTSMCYMNATNMMFLGGLIIAIAVEHCNLHKRVSLKVLMIIGCSPRRLNLGMTIVTCAISMWISNTAATAMMCPIIEATLVELESQGFGKIYDDEMIMNAEGEMVNKPSKITCCQFITIAYASSIGGIGTLVGTGTNLTLQGIYEQNFPDSPGIQFVPWMICAVPIMIVNQLLVWFVMQIIYMGMFRPNSKDAKAISVGKEGAKAAKELIHKSYQELGPMTWHEKGVALSFLLAVCLWIFREPQVIPGWATVVSKKKCADATAAFFVIMIMFFVPAHTTFKHIFDPDPDKRPVVPSQGLLTWKVIQTKIPWGLLFLLGGGFAVAAGSKESGMSAMIARALLPMTNLPGMVAMGIVALFASFLTDFSSNVAIANIILPVLSDMSKLAEWHPIYLMVPATLACSHSFSLPVSSPPNALAVAPCNIPTSELIKAGIVVSLVSWVVLLAMFPFIGEMVYHMNKFPDWAKTNTNSTTSASF